MCAYPNLRTISGSSVLPLDAALYPCKIKILISGLFEPFWNTYFCKSPTTLYDKNLFLTLKNYIVCSRRAAQLQLLNSFLLQCLVLWNGGRRVVQDAQNRMGSSLILVAVVICTNIIWWCWTTLPRAGGMQQGGRGHRRIRSERHSCPQISLQRSKQTSGCRVA